MSGDTLDDTAGDSLPPTWDTWTWAERTTHEVRGDLGSAQAGLQRGESWAVAALERAINRLSWVVERLTAGRGPVSFSDAHGDETTARQEPPTPLR